MADLQISGDYLDSLRASFTTLAALVSPEDGAAVDHSSCGSEIVASAGNYLVSVQDSRAAIAAGNATALSVHAGTTSVEVEALEASLARSAGDL
ncbi:hypothetical protein B0I08_103396 [Glaciihabitans tibetensis]|uniref:Uncharacterized protein n=1 Tax=Glaciihabitans tibetensis TaxID=1266600 RepID=A0A2T0VG56_9MICO|nr:hypothetical protein [Glaciihabitans tibetensis]PRY69188.1 hypothetical protein B0I08_103396 [Glaciihabitans tibetensis]